MKNVNRMPKARRFLVREVRNLQPGDILCRRGFNCHVRLGQKYGRHVYAGQGVRKEGEDYFNWIHDPITEDDLVDVFVYEVNIPESKWYRASYRIRVMGPSGPDVLLLHGCEQVLIINPNYLEEKKALNLWKKETDWHGKRRARRAARSAQKNAKSEEGL